MGIINSIRSWLSGDEADDDRPDTFESLTWLEPAENPFGVRVLDCRPVVETFHSETTDPDCIRFFRSAEAFSGEQFRGNSPEDAIRVECELHYAIEGPLPEGPLLIGEEMEDKWNIYRFDNALYFARSWTGQLHYVANLVLREREIQIISVQAWHGNVLGPDDMAIRQVDFLIRSHLFHQILPHPVPSFQEKKAIAMFSFSQYGRRGKFARRESDS